MRSFSPRYRYLTLSLAAVMLSVGCGGGGGGSSAPATLPVQHLNEQAKRTNAFIDSIGINTHFGADNSPYTSPNFARITPLLSDLGVRHIREAAFPTGVNAYLCAYEQTVAAVGPRFSYTTQITFTAADISNWASCAGPALEAFESVNEYDLFHPQGDANYDATLRAYQTMLYNTVKMTPSTASIAVVGPSLTSGDAYKALGDIHQVLDFNNIHENFDGFNPGTGGYGDGGYGSIPYVLAEAKPESPSGPVYVTESAYSTAAVTGGVDALTQMKYVPRDFLEEFNAGIARTYYYELLDEPQTFPAYSTQNGLVDASFTPKPAYRALRNMISVLQDTSAGAALRTIPYEIIGATSDLHHLLLQSASGDLFLLLWRESQSYDSNKHVSISVPTETLQVNLPSAAAAITGYSFNANGDMQATSYPGTPIVNLTVSDSVTILKLTGLQ